MRLATILSFIALFSPVYPLFADGDGVPRSGDTLRVASNTSLLDQLPDDVEFVPGSIIVKFTRDREQQLSKSGVAISTVQPLLAQFAVDRMIQMYPSHVSRFRDDGSEIALQRMYRVEFDPMLNPLEVARAFALLPEVEYAEPEIVQTLMYTPDDTRYDEQYQYALIEAEKAWDITTGDSTIVIAIVDSGVRWDHEDLYDNMWINSAEDINGNGRFDPWPVDSIHEGVSGDLDGIDNSGTGFVDDVIGIDFVGSSALNGGTYYDNDPTPTSAGNPHGTHVAGIAAARGSNGKGIAGLAMYSRIMAIKCAPDINTPSIIRGYDGIVYAADNGAHVINCSWGGGGYLESQKERIDYAISKGAIVVAAAGNSGSERVHTPGAYPSVLCVANTNTTDRINPSSTYGPWVDVSAPGTNILSSVSVSPTAYQKFTGTSMASPMVAGLAALVKSVYPEYLPQQVYEQIRVTADPIDDLQGSQYRRKIGKGRINAYRALTERWPAVGLVDWMHSDSLFGNSDGYPDQGERLTIHMRWRNLLEPTGNAIITLSSSNPLVTIEQGSFTAGAIPTFGEVDNYDDPFIIVLADEYAPNDQVDLMFTIEDGEYSDQGGVFFIQQPSYRDHDINDIRLTLANAGNLGFDDFDGIRGSGFRYRGSESVLFEGAFMLGAIINQWPSVVDGARSSGREQVDDFVGEQVYSIVTPGSIADQQGYGRFEDLNAPLSYRVQSRVEQRSYAFTDEELRNIIFLRYDIMNISNNLHEHLHAGLFFDWDIGANAQTDIAMFNDSLQLAVAFDTTGRPRVPVYVGMLPLNEDLDVTYWGINNRDRDDSLRIGIYNGFTKEEKWKALSQGVVLPVSDITDISQVIAVGPYDLLPGDTLVTGFALIAGESVREITDAVPHAREVWARLLRPVDITSTDLPGSSPETLLLHSAAPQPLTAGQSLLVDIGIARATNVRFDLYDLRGRFIARLSETSLSAGRWQLYLHVPSVAAGTYILHMHDGQFVSAPRFLPITVLNQ